MSYSKHNKTNKYTIGNLSIMIDDKSPEPSFKAYVSLNPYFTNCEVFEFDTANMRNFFIDKSMERYKEVMDEKKIFDVSELSIIFDRVQKVAKYNDFYPDLEDL